MLARLEPRRIFRTEAKFELGETEETALREARALRRQVGDVMDQLLARICESGSIPAWAGESIADTDARGASRPITTGLRRRSTPRRGGGYLSPMWVEWLMGGRSP